MRLGRERVEAQMRDNVVVRLKPRANEQVNQNYMCETGRGTYREFNRRDRADQPRVRSGSALVIAEWETAIEAAARALEGRRRLVLASPNLSNEALFLLERLMTLAPAAGVLSIKAHESQAA